MFVELDPSVVSPWNSHFCEPSHGNRLPELFFQRTSSHLESRIDSSYLRDGAELDAGDFRACLLKIGRRIEMDGPLMLLKAA